MAVAAGPYEILFKLAEGGMAELLLARARHQLVVLKRIRRELAGRPQLVKLFEDEARLVSAFDHPHIARSYDHGTLDGRFFFAMELVHGRDVATTLERSEALGTRFPIGPAIYVGRAVAEALHHAHERRQPDGSWLRVVHRDVSLSNIMLSYDGDVKLVDFGIADAATSSVRTRSATLGGKLPYMSPEQARGRALDRRSDVFSLGVVLWEMIATERLFDAASDAELVRRVVECRIPPLSRVRSDCPPRLEQIVTKALARDPRARYQSAAALAHDLGAFAHERGLTRGANELAAYMRRAFAPELAAWDDTWDNAITVTDYQVAGQRDATVIDLDDADLTSLPRAPRASLPPPFRSPRPTRATATVDARR